MAEAVDHPLFLWREAQGWSQPQLAKRLRVSQACISRWEWGVRIPRRKDLTAIHKLTGIAPTEFYKFAIANPLML